MHTHIALISVVLILFVSKTQGEHINSFTINSIHSSGLITARSTARKATDTPTIEQILALRAGFAPLATIRRIKFNINRQTTTSSFSTDTFNTNYGYGPRRNPFRRIVAFLRRSGSAEQQYVTSLELTIDTLKLQIRTLREESRQLRNLLSKQQSKNRISVQSREMELMGVIKDFEVRTKDLEESQLELMELLETERQRVAEQEERIQKQQETFKKAELEFKHEMEQMRATLLEQSKRQMEQLIKSTDDRLKTDAIEKQKEMDAIIEEERKKCIAAVEREKQKMRILIKAMAEREKKTKLEDLREKKKIEKAEKDTKKKIEKVKELSHKKVISAATTGANNLEPKKAVFGTRIMK